jgi:putative nucleotidyltransferase with HDIG domain
VETSAGDETVHPAVSGTAALVPASMLCVPVRHGATVVGVLKVYAARPNAFGGEDLVILSQLAGIIAAHMSHAARSGHGKEEGLRNELQTIAGLRSLARAIDAKDPSTRRHSDRVALLACAVARAIGWPKERRRLLREAAVVHDIGKIGTPDAILLKPGRLTAREYEEVKKHASLGAKIVEGVLSAEQVDWVRWHHERPDGAGYPDGLDDAAIPEGAAIVALADTWDVMTADRPYSWPKSRAVALRECHDLAGRQFKPSLVDVLPALV